MYVVLNPAVLHGQWTYTRGNVCEVYDTPCYYGTYEIFCVVGILLHRYRYTWYIYMRMYNLVWWVYISYCTDCTYSILYKQKTDKNRGDNVGFQIINFCVSTMWYFYNKQPRSKTISCGRMY